MSKEKEILEVLQAVNPFIKEQIVTVFENIPKLSHLNFHAKSLVYLFFQTFDFSRQNMALDSYIDFWRENPNVLKCDFLSDFETV